MYLCGLNGKSGKQTDSIITKKRANRHYRLYQK